MFWSMSLDKSGMVWSNVEPRGSQEKGVRGVVMSEGGHCIFLVFCIEYWFCGAGLVEYDLYGVYDSCGLCGTGPSAWLQSLDSIYAMPLDS